MSLVAPGPLPQQPWGMSQPIEVVLDDLGDLASIVARVVGVEPVRVVAQITSITLHGAAEVVRVVDAEEMERIRHEAALGEASGQAAHAASHQNFHKPK